MRSKVLTINVWRHRLEWRSTGAAGPTPRDTLGPKTQGRAARGTFDGEAGDRPNLCF